MNKKQYILAIDQGTTSCRSLLFDQEGNWVDTVQLSFPQYFPQPGWVEHNALEIWESQWSTVQQVLQKNKVEAEQIAGIGITNQRETTVIWDRETGLPIANAIVWQDRRTAEKMDFLRSSGKGKIISEKTGLVVDAYFSASKIQWLLDNVKGAREKAKEGKLAAGTIDSWLAYKLSGGKFHITDLSNASRTMLLNINDGKWDDELLGLFDIPKSILPNLVNSSGSLAHTDSALLGREIPICGMIGDQQAALFGQSCLSKGMAKNTYGTGCFMLMNSGSKRLNSQHGLISTIAWSIDDKITYALEGSVFVAGAAVQWLRDGLKIIDEAEDSEYFAQKVDDAGGVVVVPAFTGLGAPHWDQYARGSIFGLTRGVGKAELIRATLQSLAFQTRDVLDAMEQDAGQAISGLRVDGGAAANQYLMQFQADILGMKVERPVFLESTSLGAARLAMIGLGMVEESQLSKTWKPDASFEPIIDEEARSLKYGRWLKAVERCKGWEEKD